MDVESFAKEQLAGNNPEEILQRYSILYYTVCLLHLPRLKDKETDERLAIDRKVWEGRLEDASKKINNLEMSSMNTRNELTEQIEQQHRENEELRRHFESEKRATDKESFAREEKLRETEKRLREADRLIEKMHIENEQRTLDKEQHKRSEQRRLQLENEIEQLRRQVDFNQEILQKRDLQLENLERELQQVFCVA